MKLVTIYTGPLCNFCDAAKKLLTRNNVEYKEINIATAGHCTNAANATTGLYIKQPDVTITMQN